jgi:hypothetical protein
MSAVFAVAADSATAALVETLYPALAMTGPSDQAAIGDTERVKVEKESVLPLITGTPADRA